MNALAKDFDGKTSKITSATVKKEISKIDYVECWKVNIIDIFELLLIKQLPLTRITGVLLLFSAIDGIGTEYDLETSLVRR